MQRDSGLQYWLKIPFLYNLVQKAIGATALHRKFIQGHVRAKGGDKVIDTFLPPRQPAGGTIRRSKTTKQSQQAFSHNSFFHATERQRIRYTSKPKSDVARDDFFCEVEMFAQLTAVVITPTYPCMRSVA
jgi:hypothetical protein